ncbi:DNA-binding protein [Microbacterium sp. NPDC056052]|uniref:YobI family P-loop NTPase n=1 Tax=Microbacterium sp. NPDC056052 TaxID=3345695 RepID=UPI0035D94663
MTWMQRNAVRSALQPVVVPSEASAWNLLSLTPTYQPVAHGPYVAAIRAALADEKVRNIALSGNYGVGKSSILLRVSELEAPRVVELSLSTLAPVEAPDLDHNALPPQATTPTNRIQQEIVKQLLYREEPNRAPGSRFRRIERFRWPRELGLSAIVGFSVAVLFLVAGWGATVTTTLAPVVDLALWIYPTVWLVATAGFFALRYLLQGRVHIKAFSAGPAAVTLDEHSVSYFDQYLDEIVYFFETSERDIVIFEDIDRFDDSHIFETLRSLNTLLNAAPQLDRRTIRFVYAIKDSIFDRIGLESEGRKDATSSESDDPAVAEAVRANRTKFFDLIIPVVPFITHRSARNLASQLLEGLDNNVSPDLIDLAGRYVPDMRLLKNVRNEFVVFRDRIFSGDGSELDLSETDLFAMMLYKSTHLGDFEAIRLGKSNLDVLYAAHRQLVADNIPRLEADIRITRRKLAQVGKITVRSEQMGTRLLAHIERLIAAAGFNTSNPQYSLGRTAKTAEELKTADFWRELSGAGDAAKVGWRSNYTGQQLSLTRQHLVDELGDSLNASAWEEADRDDLNATLETQLEQLTFLRSADMGEVIKRPEFDVEYDNEVQSLASVAETLLTEGLAFQLMRAGHINRNFTLYTSTFHGNRVSPAATNFIIHHVEQNSMDAHFKLNGDDVDAVIRERGVSALGDPALYNIAILDHVLATDIAKADVMVASLARNTGEPAAEFLQAYLTGGTQTTKLIERLVRKSASILHHLIAKADLDDATKLHLVSHALANLAPGMKYYTDEACARYFLDNYAAMPALTADTLNAQAAVRIAIVFGMAPIKLPDITPLTETVRRAFVDRNVYTVTESNLHSALGVQADLALDQVRERDTGVYEYLLDNVSPYLAVVEDRIATNHAADGFAATIEDVLDRDVERVDDVITRASTESRIADLGAVSESAWPALARANRFPATFVNVSRYLASVGTLDENLAVVLKGARTISDVDGATEADKVALALTILGARKVLHSTYRVPLVASLALADHLGISAITPESGQLFALLVQNDVIPDDADTYDRMAGIDWEWREQLIGVSRAFKTYMTPELIGDDLRSLRASSKIGKPLKLLTLDRAAEYAAASDAAGRRELARFAITSQREVPAEVVEQLATDRVDARTVVTLLQPHLNALDDSRLFTILRTIGGKYAQLTTVGRDHPTVVNDLPHQALLKSLTARGIVSSYDAKGLALVVHKKHK